MDSFPDVRALHAKVKPFSFNSMDYKTQNVELNKAIYNLFNGKTTMERAKAANHAQKEGNQEGASGGRPALRVRAMYHPSPSTRAITAAVSR